MAIGFLSSMDTYKISQKSSLTIKKNVKINMESF